MALKVPQGGQLFVVDGTLVVAYDVGGAVVYYDFSVPGAAEDADLSAFGPHRPQLTGDEFNARFGIVIHGGVAGELADFDHSKGTYQNWMNEALKIATGNNEALLADPEVRSIFLDALANPEIGDNEVTARLRGTAYWKNLSEQGVRYNNASPEEQQRMVEEELTYLTQAWWAITGQQISTSDPWLLDWATKVAQGKTTRGMVVESTFKPMAMSNGESTWAREVRGEQEQQRQRGVDISNQTQAVKDLARRWGVSVDDAWARSVATSVIEKRTSEAQVLEVFKNQAAILYPWKDREIETAAAAQPYIQSFASIYETSEPDLLNPEIQQAMQSGQSIAEYQRHLRSQDRWLYTQNAHQSITSAVMEAGRRMGFE